MADSNLTLELKKVLDVAFIKESIYNFLPTKKPYSDLIAINNDNDFVSLSNANVFIIPILQTDQKTVEKIKDKLNHVFNREKYVVSFQKSEFEKEFENIVYIDIDNLIEHSEKNGACEKNLFTLVLKGLIFNDKTYAQQWL
jgi:hypothetical protein